MVLGLGREEVRRIVGGTWDTGTSWGQGGSSGDYEGGCCARMGKSLLISDGCPGR